MVALQQFVDGIRSYIQSDVIPHFPRDKQFLAGVALGVAANKADRIAQQLRNMTLVKTLGIIDGDMVDDEALFDAVREQMNRQGSVQIEIPWIGKITFATPDIDALQRAIHGR